VATTAESYSLKRGDAKPPISTHPAFPAIVALWFAALLGLGSLVLPIALLERLIAVSGIASLVPSAAPPLGFTAHAAIALVAAIAGSALGLLLARKIAVAHASEAAARHFSAEAAHPRRPFSAHDELGEEGLAPSFGTAPVVVQKRRSLALSEDNRRSTYLEAAPLPGVGSDAPAYLPVGTPAPPFAEADAREPLELGEFRDLNETAYDTGEIDSDPALEALRSRIHTPAETAFQDQPMTDPFSSDPSNDRGDAEGRDGFTSLEDFQPARDAVDPLPFAAPSLKRLEPTTFDEDEGDEEWEPDMEDNDGPQLSIVEYAEPDFTIDAAEAERPLEDLGLVQLAARLGASLKKRKARAAQREPAETALPIAAIAPGEGFEAAEAEDAARAMADFFAPGAAAETPAESSEPEWQDEEAMDEPVVPAPLRSFAIDSEDEADDEALAASFSLPLGTPLPAAGEPDEPIDETTEGEDEDSSYSSLLEMKNPFARQQEFVRVEEPEADSDAFEPTVTFPRPPVSEPQDAEAPSFRPFDRPTTPTNPAASAAPRDPGDAERNLRGALATLQRMSGAA
jgi:hypothetical protein